jgi:uncharacterized protein
MIWETIVTTTAADGTVHIAPMGIHERGDVIVLAPFRPSTTLDNVLATRSAVVNYCDDVRVFAGCLTGRRDWPTLPAGKVTGARLADTLAHAELSLQTIEEDELRPRLICTVAQRVMHGAFPGYNRARAAVLEAAILVSRLNMLPAEKIDREMEYLKIAIDKTAGANERQAWQWLLEAIENHRAAQSGGNLA